MVRANGVINTSAKAELGHAESMGLRVVNLGEK